MVGDLNQPIKRKDDNNIVRTVCRMKSYRF